MKKMLAILGSPRKNGNVAKMLKEFFNISGMKYGGSAIFAGTRNKKEVPERVASKIKKLIK